MVMLLLMTVDKKQLLKKLLNKLEMQEKIFQKDLLAIKEFYIPPNPLFVAVSTTEGFSTAPE